MDIGRIRGLRPSRPERLDRPGTVANHLSIAIPSMGSFRQERAKGGQVTKTILRKVVVEPRGVQGLVLPIHPRPCEPPMSLGQPASVDGPAKGADLMGKVPRVRFAGASDPATR